MVGKDGYRWYNSYRIPKQFGGGGVVEIRMDQTHADEKRGFNRTETVRVIPESDEDFRHLSTLRRDAESINRGVKDTMGYVGRAHSIGRVRQHMNLIGFGLMVNSITLHLARLSAPPGALAA